MKFFKESTVRFVSFNLLIKNPQKIQKTATKPKCFSTQLHAHNTAQT